MAALFPSIFDHDTGAFIGRTAAISISDEIDEFFLLIKLRNNM